MPFTSYEFICFVIILLVVYYLMPQKRQWYVLLIGSLFFYGLYDIRYLIYIGVSLVTTFIAARYIGDSLDKQKEWLRTEGSSLSRDEKKAYRKKCQKGRDILLWLCIVINIGIL